MTQRYTTVHNPWSIGFEDFFRRLEEVNSAMANDSYPPHNIVKIDDNHYLVELAVAGFDENELEISVQNGVLTVTGAKEDARTYVHKGISTRKFTRSWSLNEHVDVRSAALSNGLLVIELERNVPEAERPRKIKIGQKAESKKTFLSE